MKQSPRLWILPLLLAFLAGSLASRAPAAEVMPPAPQGYFNDYAGVVSRDTARQLNDRLQQFERDTSNQFVVAIFPKMQSDSSVEDYTVRVAQKWRVGQKDKNNGVVLFVFTQDRQLYIQVGYGLEGALPDILCKRIIDHEIVPRLRNGDFDAGLRAGVEAVMAATRGEYKGTGRTSGGGGNGVNPLAFIIPFVLLMFLLRYLSWRSSGYWSSGWGSGFGGSFGGGGFSSGGGFSGGGGSFGGGGAGGRW